MYLIDEHLINNGGKGYVVLHICTVSIYWWKMLVVDCKKKNGVADEISM